MYSGDDFYGDDCTSGFDVLEQVDLIRKARRETFACLGCGSLEPARLSGDCRTCSDCTLVIEDHEAFVVVADVA